MGVNPNFSPSLSFIPVHSSLHASPFSPLLPNHINSLCLSLLNIHSYYFSHAWPIFISFTSITLPLFQSRLSPSSSLALAHSLVTSLSLSLALSPSPLSFSPSQMSDHSLVFRLPCHHIFHTSPSHNCACIIISYHVEYLITARDERWPPPIPSWTGKHIYCSLTPTHSHANTNTLVSGRIGQESMLKAVSVYIFTPHVCTKLSMRLLQRDR